LQGGRVGKVTALGPTGMNLYGPKRCVVSPLAVAADQLLPLKRRV
jgi:hypothetical protein